MAKSNIQIEEPEYDTLGTNVVPLKYELTFKPDLKTFRYEGNVKIEALAVKETSEIQLNADELDISGAKVFTK